MEVIAMTIEIKKPRYNKETIEAINEAIKMMKNPKKEMIINKIRKTRWN